MKVFILVQEFYRDRIKISVHKTRALAERKRKAFERRRVDILSPGPDRGSRAKKAVDAIALGECPQYQWIYERTIRA